MWSRYLKSLLNVVTCPVFSDWRPPKLFSWTWLYDGSSLGFHPETLLTIQYNLNAFILSWSFQSCKLSVCKVTTQFAVAGTLWENRDLRQPRGLSYPELTLLSPWLVANRLLCGPNPSGCRFSCEQASSWARRWFFCHPVVVVLRIHARLERHRCGELKMSYHGRLGSGGQTLCCL